MGGWRRRIATALDAPGASGSWGRRAAQGAQALSGAAIGALGQSGSWFKRLAMASGASVGASGSHDRRLANGATAHGGWDRILDTNNILEGSGAPANALALNGEALTLNGQTLTLN